ncbi:ran-binding protein 17 [Platysternon megacephalum]|uniref:Ran-binding protein 17 n=1 Tax=Platysternon megacephalum TaxID=55544 RepID=A0A4D9EW63_9SAUR|nr:ran-binding protein 17 [Platysternon megacephalum]
MLDKHVLSFLPSSCDMKRRMNNFFAVNELHHEQWKTSTQKAEPSGYADTNSKGTLSSCTLQAQDSSQEPYNLPRGDQRMNCDCHNSSLAVGKQKFTPFHGSVYS